MDRSPHALSFHARIQLTAELEPKQLGNAPKPLARLRRLKRIFIISRELHNVDRIFGSGIVVSTAVEEFPEISLELAAFNGCSMPAQKGRCPTSLCTSFQLWSARLLWHARFKAGLIGLGFEALVEQIPPRPTARSRAREFEPKFPGCFWEN
jgi:hypothetical protein